MVLPGSLQEEDEGIVTTAEGRVIKINKAVECPGEAREDWRIIQDIAQALHRPHGFTFSNPREILDELRVASRSSIADYSGISYEKIERQDGVLACPADDLRYRRLFEPESWNPVAQGKGPFYFPDGKARFNLTAYAPPTEETKPRLSAHVNHRSGCQPFLVRDANPPDRSAGGSVSHPFIEIHPQLAARVGLVDGDWATAESRRGSCTLRVRVVKTIRPDTIFIPYHWSEEKSANQLTIAAQDPISKIPEYKVCAARLKKATAPPSI